MNEELLQGEIEDEDCNFLDQYCDELEAPPN